MDLERHFATRVERFEHGDFSVDLLLPASSEELIDEREFDADERLPYWAELWPSAVALARHLLESPALPDRSIELGCGVGLPSLALGYRGVNALATDYYTEALEFTRANAARNGLTPPATLLVDWRDPPPLEPVPLVVAADVLYEARNADALRALLPAIIEPGGSALLADPGRVHFEPFVARMTALGWRAERLADRTEASPAGGGRKITVGLTTLSPPDSR